MKRTKLVSFSGMILLAAALAVTTGCGRRDYPRGQFTGYVMGKTDAEIVDKVGQPAKLDLTKPDEPVMTYNAKTFDPDNLNQADPVTRIFMKRQPDGKIIAIDVVFG
jgi:hypothetical protein